MFVKNALAFVFQKLGLSLATPFWTPLLKVVLLDKGLLFTDSLNHAGNISVVLNLLIYKHVYTCSNEVPLFLSLASFLE